MLRVALLGCGFMGRMHATVYKALEGAALVGVASRNGDKAQACAEEFGTVATGLDEALSDPNVDAVDLCLPTFLHKEYTVKAAKAGKHVVCEKPMAMTVGEADEMIAKCERAGVKLMIAHCIRFWPEYEHLKTMIDSGDIGRLTSLNLTRYGQFPTWSSDNWLADESKAGGGALDMHIHDTDYAVHVLGKPASMTSRGVTDGRGIGQIFTTMTYPGTIVHAEGGWNLPTGTPFKMSFRAIFERGAAIMDGGPLTVYRDGAEPEVPEFTKMEAAGGGNVSDLGGYYRELSYFVDCVSNDRPLDRCTPQSSRESLELVLSEIALAKSI